jgi:hypothetical protein
MKAMSVVVVVSLPMLTVTRQNDFGSRVQRAKLIEASSEGEAYQKQLWASAGNKAASAMQACFPRGVKVDTESFTLVGDVNNQHHLQNVEVHPSTPMSRCFAKRFSSLQFPELPESMHESGMPLVVDMKIIP